MSLRIHHQVTGLMFAFWASHKKFGTHFAWFQSLSHRFISVWHMTLAFWQQSTQTPEDAGFNIPAEWCVWTTRALVLVLDLQSKDLFGTSHFTSPLLTVVSSLLLTFLCYTVIYSSSLHFTLFSCHLSSLYCASLYHTYSHIMI